MKKIIWGVVLLFLLADYAEDMQKYLTDTQQLMRRGAYKEALDRYIWFHDHALEHNAAMYGVRLSFALAYWKQLSAVYAPALDAMKQIRDKKTALLENGQGSFELYHDVEALNSTLEQNEKSVELFRKLDQENGPLAAKCWEVAKEHVIKAKAYDLAQKYMGDPLQAFYKARSNYDLNASMDVDKKYGESFKTFYENQFIDETLRIIKVAIASDNVAAAKEVQEKALIVLDDNRIRNAIQ
jgi:hypothetical protein